MLININCCAIVKELHCTKFHRNLKKKKKALTQMVRKLLR